jgi:N-acetylglucosamine repressor
MKNNLKDNSEFSSDINTTLVLKIIWKHSSISRSDIVNKTNLTAATVSRIVKKLISCGFVKEVGYGESNGGRKPIIIELNPKAAMVIGIDIEIDEINGVLVDLKGNILGRETVKNKEVEQEKILKKVKDIINKLMKVNNFKYKEKVIGIGIGMHGLVDYYKGVCIYPPAFGWSNVPVAEIIQKEFKLPVILDNNERALAQGEKWFGVAKNMQNFICLKVGAGIGSGIFTNGTLYRGISMSAGEIGHIVVDEDGPLCICGNYGCLDSLATIPALIKRTIKIIRQGAESKIYSMVDGKLDTINEDIIFEAAKNDDAIALQILRDTGRYLGIAIANIINVLNPEAVIVEGKIIEAGEFVFQSLRETVKNKALSYPFKKVRIIPGVLGSNGVAIGASTLILERFLNFGKLKLAKQYLL